MSAKLKKLLRLTSYSILIISIGFFCILKLVYGFLDQSFKDSLTYTLSLLSVLATGGAAIIAAALVQDWKKQHDYSEQLKVLVEMINVKSKLKHSLSNARNNRIIRELFNYRVLDKKTIKENYFKQLELYDLTKKDLNQLYELELKLFLLSDCSEKIFSFDNELKNPIESLFEILNLLAYNQWELVNFVSSENPQGPIYIENLDFTDGYTQSMIIRLDDNGYELLNLEKGVIEDYAYAGNLYTLEIKSVLLQIEKRIIDFKKTIESKI